jgi:hypothetical protein
MPSGTFQVVDIPEDRVATVVAGYQLDLPSKIEKIRQSNGLWTVRATFGDGGPAAAATPGGTAAGLAASPAPRSAATVLEFAGDALPLSDQDFADAARQLGCDVAAIRAVAQVESGGRSGFLADRRPKILFESRKFSKLTGGRYDASHPDISTASWVRNYRGGAAEYERLAQAMALDRAAALKSASWGMFQILGENHGAAGFADVEAFVAENCRSEGGQLRCFVNFVIHEGLAGHLIGRNWEEFARRYNGPRFAENNYHTKIAQAYESHSVA